jgi:hypothetical protein
MRDHSAAAAASALDSLGTPREVSCHCSACREARGDPAVVSTPNALSSRSTPLSGSRASRALGVAGSGRGGGGAGLGRAEWGERGGRGARQGVGPGRNCPPRPVTPFDSSQETRVWDMEESVAGVVARPYRERGASGDPGRAVGSGGSAGGARGRERDGSRGARGSDRAPGC